MRPMASWSNLPGVNASVFICCVILLSVVLTAFVVVFYADFVNFLYTALIVVVLY